MPVQNRFMQYQRDQRQYFNELITEDWDTYHSPDWDYTRTFEVRQLFCRIQPKCILNIGCGCGFRDVLMAKYPFVERVDAIDYSEKSIMRAETSCPHSKVHRVVADFSTYKPRQLYDLIVSFQVFEHLYNPGEYMRFCAQHCAPGKWVAICTPNQLRIDNRIRRLSGKSITMTDPMHFKEYSVSQIAAMGQTEGLIYKDHYGHGLHPFTMFNRSFLTEMAVEKRTRYGYLMPSMASIIMVIMKKADDSCLVLKG